MQIIVGLLAIMSLGSMQTIGFDNSIQTIGKLNYDVNLDGIINVLDITKLERIIVKLDNGLGDVNGDGKTNSLDITKLEIIIANREV